jgi:plasmid stabilization system protein ParE
MADLQEIGDYIARDIPLRAASFVRELLAHTQRIAERPEAYPARPELSNGLRSCAHQRYVIFFTASTERVRIERIIHGSRDITDESFDLEEPKRLVGLSSPEQSTLIGYPLPGAWPCYSSHPGVAAPQ